MHIHYKFHVSDGPAKSENVLETRIVTASEVSILSQNWAGDWKKCVQKVVLLASHWVLLCALCGLHSTAQQV